MYFLLKIQTYTLEKMYSNRFAHTIRFIMISSCTYQKLIYFFIFSNVRLLSVLCGHSVFSSPPQRPMTSDFEGFLYQILSIALFSYLNSRERASIFPLQCWVLNKVTTATIFIMSLVWRGPWLGIEPGTSRTRSPYHVFLHFEKKRLKFYPHVILKLHTVFWDCVLYELYTS